MMKGSAFGDYVDAHLPHGSFSKQDQLDTTARLGCGRRCWVSHGIELR